MPDFITATMLYDLVHCPHRVTMDLYADSAERDDVSPFVQLLWERGALFEKEVVGALDIQFLDLSSYTRDERERLTREAMERGEPFIYAGRIRANDLLGEPDLLRHEGAGYVAGDIKSGSGEEGGDDEEDGKPKKHYAVQLALYTDILEQLGKSAGRRAFVWDIHGEEVTYDFVSPYGQRNPRTLWEDYQDVLYYVRGILAKTRKTLPACASACKNCVWYTACLRRLEEADDLTLIPQLGRSKRDVMLGEVSTVADLAACNPAGFVKGKKTIFPGIGPSSLEKFHARARLLSIEGSQPYIREPIRLPAFASELFFDIEVDPMRDICYLHGFVERIDANSDAERFVYFLAEEPTPGEEKRAFAEAVAYMRSSRPCGIYYYSKYERSWYRKLRIRYPDVISEDEVEELFDPSTAVDLYYDVVLKATEWPTRDFSIKTLAKHLGFAWRDMHPSGAASIEWYHRWVETGDAVVRQRILDYNEDDCRATRVLLDGIRALT